MTIPFQIDQNRSTYSNLRAAKPRVLTSKSAQKLTELPTKCQLQATRMSEEAIKKMERLISEQARNQKLLEKNEKKKVKKSTVDLYGLS